MSHQLTVQDIETLDDKLPLDELQVLYGVEPGPGLSDAEVAERSNTFGPNALREVKKSKILMFLGFMWNPMSWIMWIAMLVAFLMRIPRPDWEDGVGIIILLVINATIGYIEESAAGDAVAALMSSLAPGATVRRNGVAVEIQARDLVPGDVCLIKLGQIVPADGRLIEGDDGMKVDQAALTGESLAVSKRVGDVMYSGSTVKQGEGEFIVTSTGERTFIGRAAKLVATTENSGHFQQVLGYIGLFCIGQIALMLVLLISIQYAVFALQYEMGVNNILTILIGGVPLAMPTVLSVTLAMGATQLAKKKAIVTRITAIEELAGMNVLCSDKTGTLTLNELTVYTDQITTYSEASQTECVKLAGYSCRLVQQDAIDKCISETAASIMGVEMERIKDGIKEVHFMPFDPTGKRTQVTYQESDGKLMRVTKGAPQIILDLCLDKDDPKYAAAEKDIDDFARKGYRALGVATCEVKRASEGEVITATIPPNIGRWKLVCNLPIYDPPRHDTADTIHHALQLGVPVKMITGDAIAIAIQTAKQLSMGTNIHQSSDFFGPDGQPKSGGAASVVEAADGFAGVFPEHKYEIVNILQKSGHTVGMTGDGVNDAPALKKGNVGIAVADATDAARAAADIVLTAKGLSVIIDAISMSRQIFTRMQNYSVYACATTVGIVIRFGLAYFIFQFNMPPFAVLIMAYLNDGTIMAISKDTAIPSPTPCKWNLKNIFIEASVYGLWMSASTLIFIYTINGTCWWAQTFSGWGGLANATELTKYECVPTGKGNELRMDTSGLNRNGCGTRVEAGLDWWECYGINNPVLHSIIYLQLSILGQALIFSVRSRTLAYIEPVGKLLVCAFIVAQLASTFIACYADWYFTYMKPIYWGWVLAVWVWNIMWFLPIDLLKLAVRHFLYKEHEHCFGWGVYFRFKEIFSHTQDRHTKPNHSMHPANAKKNTPKSRLLHGAIQRRHMAIAAKHGVSKCMHPSHIINGIHLPHIGSKSKREGPEHHPGHPDAEPEFGLAEPSVDPSMRVGKEYSKSVAAGRASIRRRNSASVKSKGEPSAAAGSSSALPGMTEAAEPSRSVASSVGGVAIDIEK